MGSPYIYSGNQEPAGGLGWQENCAVQLVGSHFTCVTPPGRSWPDADILAGNGCFGDVWGENSPVSTERPTFSCSFAQLKPTRTRTEDVGESLFILFE